jgi:hypothetical protein
MRPYCPDARPRQDARTARSIGLRYHAANVDTTLTKHAPLPPFERHWLAEAIRLQERRHGPLEDADAVRQARRAPPDAAARILARAEVLARREGLVAQVRPWQRQARAVLAVLALLAVAGGAGSAASVLGTGIHPVNVVWAIAGLLGLHALMLLLWCVGLLLPAAGGASLGRAWLWLTERLAHPFRASLLPAALASLLGRTRLARWWLGAVSHGLWTLALLSALLTLLALLATRRYDFVWETTILPADGFVALVRGLGAVPGWLGFAVPDPATVRASGDAPLADAEARHAWSAWLVGCLVVYGLAPRLLLWLGCLAGWYHGRRTLRLDTGLPGYAELVSRLLPASDRLGVHDPAPPLPPPIALRAHRGGTDAGRLVVGLELGEDIPWPPPLGHARDGGRVAAREERHALADALAAHPPERLLVACDGRLSPDRGSVAFIHELAGYAGQTAVWLMAPRDEARRVHWHEALAAIPWRFDDRDQALAWLEDDA